MPDCQSLIHPFQYDPGVSQHQRIMTELLSGDAKIDARTMADLLNYFSGFARQVNYYDTNLDISDWQPFFSNSLPFGLASVIKYNAVTINDKLDLYTLHFKRRPSEIGLQLSIHYIFYNVIRPIGKWHRLVKDSGLAIENVLQKIISEKLREPIRKFIALMNAAAKWYGVKRIDMTSFVEEDIWGLDITDVYSIDESFLAKTIGETKRLVGLQAEVTALFPSFLEVIKILAVSPEIGESLTQSMVPLKEELRQKHTPHLALLFAFLKIFQRLTEDLNGYTRKHLDFFYIGVLQLQAKEAVPDKVHVLFELQNQLKKHALKKGLLVKDGKDEKKAEILFALDDEIVVNKTQVAEVRTLFVNNQTANEQVYVEGLYMAPKANKADGVDKEFKDPGPKNYPTLGAKYSKYTEPGKTDPKQYPLARTGFILASPVLLLKEGNRKVDISIACQLNDNCSLTAGANTGTSDPCCGSQGTSTAVDEACNPPVDFIPTGTLYPFVQKFLKATYYIITEDLVLEAVRKGLAEDIATKIRNIFLLYHCGMNLCCDHKKYKQVAAIKKRRWNKFLTNPYLTIGDKIILAEIFKEQTPFRISFSGEKEWISPKVPAVINMIDIAQPDSFTLSISTTVMPDQPAVTFYDKEALKEDFGTKQPLVKIELNNDISLVLNKKLRKKLGLQKTAADCCMSIDQAFCESRISLYQFFRNYNVEAATKIDVTVCGLKTFIVQNDEGVQDANSPFPFFGSRPKINSNFYIGSEEIFLKKWSDININMNWKDLPPVPTAGQFAGKPFERYYNGYQDYFIKTDTTENPITDAQFKMQLAVLQDGDWLQWNHAENCGLAGDPECMLFQPITMTGICPDEDKKYAYQYQVRRVADYPAPGLPFPKEELVFTGIKRYDANTRQKFLRITLKCQDFQHEKYPYVLARQMTALGKLPELVAGAVYFNVDPVAGYQVLNLNEVFNNIINAFNISEKTTPEVTLIQDMALAALNTPAGHFPVTDADKITFIKGIINTLISVNFVPPIIPVQNFATLKDAVNVLHSILKSNKEKVDKFLNSGVVIPSPPWTPFVENISLNYKASATIEDIDMIHPYPYAGTYKAVEIQAKPSLLPVFCDEGNLFIALKDLEPGSTLHLLFQLAEATADSESDKEKLHWYFLANNEWRTLRTGFEILNDATNGLTTSGVVKFSLPGNISIGNTIMPKDFFWIRASVAMNSIALSETIGIHAQAISATFTNSAANDKLRLSKSLPAGSVATLSEADVSIKKIGQPYESFGGAVPELEGNYYLRVSELLRHKGRAIQKFDYERLALETFPQLFKAKCINHSFALNAHQYINDFPMAPGYVILAVIPDLNKLKAGESFEPKAPVSTLEKIQEYLRHRVSPFVRLRVMNPRYERVHFCLKVKLVFGKDENYYKEKLKQDLREFLAPWAVGVYDKLDFGQQVHRSDIIGFLESRDYLDYIVKLEMAHETATVMDPLVVTISPKTPRSILLAGDIDVCIPANNCEQWGEEKCDEPTIMINDYCKEKLTPVG